MGVGGQNGQNRNQHLKDVPNTFDLQHSSPILMQPIKCKCHHMLKPKSCHEEEPKNNFNLCNGPFNLSARSINNFKKIKVTHSVRDELFDSSSKLLV